MATHAMIGASQKYSFLQAILFFAGDMFDPATLI